MVNSTLAYFAGATIVATGIAAAQSVQRNGEKALPISPTTCMTTGMAALSNNHYSLGIGSNQLKGEKAGVAAVITCTKRTNSETLVSVLVTAPNPTALATEYALFAEYMGLGAPAAQPSSNPPPPQYVQTFQPMMAGVQLDGPSLGSFDIANSAQCQNLCMQNAGCRAFSWVSPIARAQPIGQCTLLKAPFISRQTSASESGMRIGVTVGFDHRPGLTNGIRQEFRDPRVSGLFADHCWTNGRACGQEGADNYCANIGWRLSASFQTSTTNATTFRGGDQTLCRSNCTYFTSITCEK